MLAERLSILGCSVLPVCEAWHVSIVTSSPTVAREIDVMAERTL